MWNNKLIFIFVIYLFDHLLITIQINVSGKFRLCVVEHNFTRNVCKNFGDNDPFECVFEIDRLSCMRQLTDSNVDFTVFEPEDLVVYTSAYSTSHMLITHELRLDHTKLSSFEMIAIVSRDIRSLSDLKGKKFCHPGFDLHSSQWTRIFANFFQSWIAPKKCEPETTLIDNELSSLSEYFSDVCIAGSWVPDVDEDNRLKMKHHHLHALCEKDPTDQKYYGNLGAIRCLIDSVGDIAWVRLIDFNQYSEISDKLQPHNFLCSDGLARPIARNDPCIWISRPWPVIAAHINKAEKVSQLINEAKNELTSWYKYLLEALEVYHTFPEPLDNLKIPEDYLHQFNGFSTANMRATCSPSRDIKWCVASTIENQKCQWMSDVAIAYGIEPAISCQQFHQRDACIEAIKNGHSELFIAKPEELAVAYNKKLTSLLQMMSKNTEDLNTFGIIVKNDSNLWKLEDLQGKRACFPSQQGVEWNAFVNAMRKQNNKLHRTNSMWNCSDVRAMNYFFKEIIINYDETKDKNKMENDNPMARTYDCLISGRGDVAFVNLHYSNQKYFYKSKYKLRNICIDEVEQKNLNGCILTWTPLATAMVHVNMSKVRRTEIQTMLSLLDESFGFKLGGRKLLSFSLYGSFNHEDNVIFPMKTHYLQKNIDHILQLPRDYLTILAQLGKHNDELSIYCNAANLYATINVAFVIISMMIITATNFILSN